MMLVVKLAGAHLANFFLRESSAYQRARAFPFHKTSEMAGWWLVGFTGRPLFHWNGPAPAIKITAAEKNHD